MEMNFFWLILRSLFAAAVAMSLHGFILRLLGGYEKNTARWIIRAMLGIGLLLILIGGGGYLYGLSRLTDTFGGNARHEIVAIDRYVQWMTWGHDLLPAGIFLFLIGFRFRHS